jgi:hypothetical protein
MGNWRIGRWSVILLSGVLIVTVLVLVLPQVDLLDTAFRLGTAPIAVHAQGTAKPTFQTLSALFVFFLFASGVTDQRAEDRILVGIQEVQILNQVFRC